MSRPPQPPNPARRKRYYRGPGPCTALAKCGAPCCLINSVPHEAHTCGSRYCAVCKAVAAYA